MSNLQIKDAGSTIQYLKMDGAGTIDDPFQPVQKVYIQDHVHLIKSIPFKRNTNVTTLTADAVPDTNVISVTDATGFTPGATVSIMCIGSDMCYIANIISVASLDITLDTPIDFAYTMVDSTISVGTTNLAEDGSATSVIFSIRPDDPGINTTFHITKLSLAMITGTTPILSDFGDIGDGLTNGFVIRKKDGSYQNLFNIKTNANLAAYGSHFEILQSVGVDGVLAKNIFAGPENFGAVISLAPGEDLEIIIQDDLSGLTSFSLIAQGHVVETV